MSIDFSIIKNIKIPILEDFILFISKNINLSIIKNIDFSNKENLFYLFIFLVIFLIILAFFILSFSKILNFVVKIIIWFFEINIIKSKKNKKSVANLSNQPQKIKNIEDILKQKNIVNSSNMKSDATVAELQKEKNQSGGNFSKNSSGKNSEKDKQKITREAYIEKEKKSISEHLNRLKTNKEEKKATLESIMPPRTSEQQEDIYKKIEIPTSTELHNDQRGLVPGFSKIKNNTIGLTSGKQSETDSSIFGGSAEISREKLEDIMGSDAKVWQAQKQVGLNLSPLERTNLAKEIFPSLLGRNISKSDLKWTVNKLSQKMQSTKNPVEHDKIRKEINLFKKIGGIK